MQSVTRRILCVDRDGETCSLINALLGPSGFVSKKVSTMAAALRLAKSERFDLYLLGERLPGGSRLALCRKIRQFDPRTPILFFAGATRKSERRQAIEAGAQGYLRKPEGVYELAKVITWRRPPE